MKRVLPILVVTLFLAGIFIVPAGVSITPARLQETTILNDVTLEQDADLSWLPADKTIRVAIYNETNSTTPDYASGNMNTNYTVIYNLMTTEGYQVSRLTVQDILDHDLITANFDVLILADNCPRENISDYVREFWLGGGGILSFDSSAGYLGWAGILPRETLGTDHGRDTYWSYRNQNQANISIRHPVTKSYAMGEQLTINEVSNYAQYDTTALVGTSIASDIVYLAMDEDNSNWFQAVALDPTDKGGKVVHIGVSMDPWASDWEDMTLDAVEWLCPRPKGRILFDLSHIPHYGIDSWDTSVWSDYHYSNLRDYYVGHSYTVDKLYPSVAGNLTQVNLMEYDMLIFCESSLEITLAEINDVTNWINTGGSLLALNDAPYQPTAQQYLNNLTRQVGFEMNTTVTGSADITRAPYGTHPMHEGISTIRMYTVGAINISSSVFFNVETLYEDGAGNVLIAASEYGDGRVILAADRRFLTNGYIAGNANTQFAINAANWLTSGNVEILLYTSEPLSSNYYRT
ncbi:MAG: hypothetical protein P1Q69_19920, partial [Candidatus Thorarchaeota archaeon]|nr:hypothetical protein [Candidatus Thorarchaeota archaeon]